jgi:hypothetical protein
MIPANAQNEFKSLLDSKSVTGWHTYGKSTVEMHGKLKWHLHFDPTAENNQGEIATDKMKRRTKTAKDTDNFLSR